VELYECTSVHTTYTSYTTARARRVLHRMPYTAYWYRTLAAAGVYFFISLTLSVYCGDEINKNGALSDQRNIGRGKWIKTRVVGLTKMSCSLSRYTSYPVYIYAQHTQIHNTQSAHFMFIQLFWANIIYVYNIIYMYININIVLYCTMYYYFFDDISFLLRCRTCTHKSDITRWSQGL